MDNEQLMAYLKSLPPEQQQAAIQKIQEQQGNVQPVDPKMGLPGMTNEQSIAAGDPNAFRDYAGEGDIISDEQKQAQALRGTATPEGIHTQNAGYIAASPLSHIATAAQRIRGNMAADEALEEKRKLSGTITSTQQNVAEKARKRNANAARKNEIMEQEMRNNRRGGTPLEIMADNQDEQGYS